MRVGIEEEKTDEGIPTIIEQKRIKPYNECVKTKVNQFYLQGSVGAPSSFSTINTENF